MYIAGGKKPHYKYTKINMVRLGEVGMMDIALRKGVYKLPMSHIFYVMGKNINID